VQRLQATPKQAAQKPGGSSGQSGECFTGTTLPRACQTAFQPARRVAGMGAENVARKLAVAGSGSEGVDKGAWCLSRWFRRGRGAVWQSRQSEREPRGRVQYASQRRSAMARERSAPRTKRARGRRRPPPSVTKRAGGRRGRLRNFQAG
jgi:hypothetical protein